MVLGVVQQVSLLPLSARRWQPMCAWVAQALVAATGGAVSPTRRQGPNGGQ